MRKDTHKEIGLRCAQLATEIDDVPGNMSGRETPRTRRLSNATYKKLERNVIPVA
jgi:hypothetical protein